MSLGKLVDSFGDSLGLAQCRAKRKRLMNNSTFKKLFFSDRERSGELLSQTEFFHGTGALHYVCEGGSKYGRVTGEVGDSLQSFLSDGLKPQEDVMNEGFRSGVDATISLTRIRVYARLYADLYRYEKDGIEFEYGTRSFWWKFFLLKMGIAAGKDVDFYRSRVEILFESVRPSTRSGYVAKRKRQARMTKLWSHSFRSDEKYDKDPLGLLLRAKSDIPDNFPIIVGIRKGVVKPLSVAINLSELFYEVRYAGVIAPDQFTCLQVPLTKVVVVRERIDELGIDLPIVPLEIAELIDSEKTMENLLLV